MATQDPIADIPESFKPLSVYKGWRIGWTDWIPAHKEFGISAHVAAFHPELGDRGLIVTLPDFRLGTYIEGEALPEPFGDPLSVVDGAVVVENATDDTPPTTLYQLEKLAIRKVIECVEDYIAGNFPNGDRLVIGNHGAYADWGKPWRRVDGLGDGGLAKAAALKYEAEQAKPFRQIKATIGTIRLAIRRIAETTKFAMRLIVRDLAKYFRGKAIEKRELGALEKKLGRGL